MRKPNPFTAFTCPPEWRDAATLDGKRVDLVEAFSTLDFDDLARIEIPFPDGSKIVPWTKGFDYREQDYADCEGLLAREDLVGITDADLEKRIATTLGVRVDLANGDDTSEKQFVRRQGHDLLMDRLAITK